MDKLKVQAIEQYLKQQDIKYKWKEHCLEMCVPGGYLLIGNSTIDNSEIDESINMINKSITELLMVEQRGE